MHIHFLTSSAYGKRTFCWYCEMVSDAGLIDITDVYHERRPAIPIQSWLITMQFSCFQKAEKGCRWMEISKTWGGESNSLSRYVFAWIHSVGGDFTHPKSKSWLIVPRNVYSLLETVWKSELALYLVIAVFPMYMGLINEHNLEV